MSRPNKRETLTQTVSVAEQVGEKEFFLVWKRGTRVPFFEHESLESATKEAIRLSTEHGGAYIVLRPVVSLEKADVKVVRFAAAGVGEDDIPF